MLLAASPAVNAQTATLTPSFTPTIPPNSIVVTTFNHEVTTNTSDPLVDPAKPETRYLQNSNCALREAILAVNYHTQVDACRGDLGYTLIVMLNGTYPLTAVDNAPASGANGLPVITTTMTIEGNNATVQQSSTSAYFRFILVTASAHLTARNLALLGGYLDTGFGGGAIRNDGTLTLDHVTLSGGGTGEGGALYNAAGATATISYGTIQNSPSYNGGGIANRGTMTVSNTIFINNGGSYLGGAFFNAGSLTITDSRFIANAAGSGTNPGGGVIYNQAPGTVTIHNSCMIGNSHDSPAILNVNGTATLDARGNWWNRIDATDGRPGPVGPNTDPTADRISTGVAWSTALPVVPPSCPSVTPTPSLTPTSTSTATNTPTPSAVPSSYETAVLADNPVSYWRLGETSGSTAVDSADGNTGTLMGGVTLGVAGALPYESNTAMGFNGSTGYVNVPTNANLNITGNLTLEAWAKPTALNSVSMVIVHKGDANTYQYKLGMNSSNKWRGTVYIGANTYDLVASSAAVVGRWDHLALVRNGTTLILYVNGVSVANSTISANALNTGSGALAIGRKGSLVEDYFTGAIDEVAVYNSALSPTRITAHYQTGLPGGVTPTPSLLPPGSSYPTHVLVDNPVGYWRLGEASGTTAYNQVSGETNGVINGGVTLGAPGALSNDPNTALTFDGTSGYVSVDNNTTLTIRNDLSLEAWALPDAANFNGYPHTVAHKGGYQYRIRLTASGAWQGTVYINGTAYDATDTCPALANAWYHLALTRTGSALRLYVNGVNVATNTGLPATGLLDRSSSYNPNVLGIGRKISDSADYFKGSIDEVAVYNTALSDSRITAHYNAGRPSGFAPQGFAPLSVCQAPPTVTPTPTPTFTPTPTPTLTPGVCAVVANQKLRLYPGAESAAIADEYSKEVEPGTQFEVYRRSNIYLNLVEVATSSEPTVRAWIDSGNNAVSPSRGECNQLPIQNSNVNNPQSKPTYSRYPLHPQSVSNPADMELYQFAIWNTIYTTTVKRHPGIDFIQGPISQGLGAGMRVAAVADGNIVGYFDPTLSTNVVTGISPWVDGISPTDKSANPARAYLVVRHGNTIVLYAHLQLGLRINPNVGSPIVAGQWIGLVAQSEEGPHLHLEVRNYDSNPFDITQRPSMFVNPWQYFNATIQGYLDQNIINRKNDDGQAVPGWNSTYSGGTQNTQCFDAPRNPPSDAPPGATAGIVVYGYDASGNSNYSAFEWPTMTSPFVVTLSGTWQSRCLP